MSKPNRQEYNEELKEGDRSINADDRQDIDDSIDSSKSVKRGRPKLPVVWSKVILITP